MIPESCFVLNGHVSRWAALNAWVPQGSILGPLFIIYLFIYLFIFWIYINNLLTGLSSNASFFADDLSLFSFVRNMTSSANVLNNDLKNEKWKMSFKLAF